MGESTLRQAAKGRLGNEFTTSTRALSVTGVGLVGAAPQPTQKMEKKKKKEPTNSIALRRNVKCKTKHFFLRVARANASRFVAPSSVM